MEQQNYLKYHHNYNGDKENLSKWIKERAIEMKNRKEAAYASF